MTTKHILFSCALLTPCLALHALTEEDIATLDAAFEATFREGPTGGMGVWTDPSKVRAKGALGVSVCICHRARRTPMMRFARRFPFAFSAAAPRR